MRHIALIAAGLAVTTPALAQPADTLRLGDLQRSAIRGDPRTAQADLIRLQTRLRIENIRAERYPLLTVEGVAQYQSDVTRFGAGAPGLSIPTPSHDTYDARIVAQQRILDPTRSPRRQLDEAQQLLGEANLGMSLYPNWQQVNDAFFTALRSQAQIAEVETSITDLGAQADVAGARVREGAALPSEELTIRAELLRRRQVVGEWRAAQRAALAILESLTGTRLDSGMVLGEPDLAQRAATALAIVDSARGRPEFGRFALEQLVLQRQEAVRAASDKPRVSIFARAGYGKPGLNPMNTSFDSYWLAGIQAQWNPWTWGTSARDIELLRIQQRRIDTERSSFMESLRRAVQQDLASIDRLAATLAADDEIIALRERVLVETRARYREGVINSAEYVDRQTDVLAARVSRALHRVELAQARARLLTTLGIEVP